MKIVMTLDQKAMSKSRKFIYFITDDKNKYVSELLTEPQAKVVFTTLYNLGADIKNNTGLTF